LCSPKKNFWMKQKTITTPPFKLNGRSLRRYQKGNQNPFIEEEQTTQWPKEKVQKDKQRSTKHTYKAIVTSNTNPTKTWSKCVCSGRGIQFLLHWWHLSCCSSYKYSDKSWRRKCKYGKLEIWFLFSPFKMMRVISW
jgi:hypothetical protein